MAKQNSRAFLPVKQHLTAHIEDMEFMIQQK